MTVRHEIAEARRETGARRPETPTRTRAVREGSGWASPPAEGSSQQRIGGCSRSAHE